jgi:hypothetical protein
LCSIALARQGTTSADSKPGFEWCWSAHAATSGFATPLAYRNHAYFVSQQGVVYCLDLQTWEEGSSKRINGPCWASPLGDGDYVNFFGKHVQTTVFKTGPRLERVATDALWDDAAEPVNTSAGGKSTAEQGGGYELGTTVHGVVAVDGALFVSTGTALYRIGKR